VDIYSSPQYLTVFRSLLSKLGFGSKRREVSQVKLDIIADQVKEFEAAKKQINTKLHTLEERTEELDSTIHEALDMTRENQGRLLSIEDDLERIVEMSERIVAAKIGVQAVEKAREKISGDGDKQ
jgi:chromosome segregation ATPase